MWSKKSSCSHSLTHRKIFAVAEHLGESGLQSRLAVLLHVPSVQSGVGGLVYVEKQMLYDVRCCHKEIGE